MSSNHCFSSLFPTCNLWISWRVLRNMLINQEACLNSSKFALSLSSQGGCIDTKRWKHESKIWRLINVERYINDPIMSYFFLALLTRMHRTNDFLYIGVRSRAMVSPWFHLVVSNCSGIFVPLISLPTWCSLHLGSISFIISNLGLFNMPPLELFKIFSGVSTMPLYSMHKSQLLLKMRNHGIQEV